MTSPGEGRDNPALQVLYCDEALLIVNKPAGLAVHRGWARERVTLLSLVRDQLGQFVYPAHRLDRGTSGAILFARDPVTVSLLQRSFESGAVGKLYLALVRGPAPPCGYVDHAIAKQKGLAKRPAYSAFECLKTFERYSLVRVRPYTGRLHQVRRHMKFLSLPLIGDTKYGKGEHNRIYRERFQSHRLILHAARLSFPHPHSGDLVAVGAPLTSELTTLFERLGMLEQAEMAIASDWDPDVRDLPVFGDGPEADVGDAPRYSSD